MIEYPLSSDIDWYIQSPTIRGATDGGTATVTASLFGEDGSLISGPVTCVWNAPLLAYIGTFPPVTETVGVSQVNHSGRVDTTYTGVSVAFFRDYVVFTYQV